MTAKEYLSQTKHLDTRINSKMLELEALNALATKATAVLTGMPHSPNRGASTMEDTICKIIDLQAEINADVDALVDLKRSIRETIKGISDTELQTLLELRYLQFKTWEEIAVALHYDSRHIHRLHKRALQQINCPEMS